MSREDIEEAIEVLEDASAEMLTETGEENYYCEAIAILRQALSGEAVKHIKTWNERCEEHPDHQERIISERMIQERMQEEIDELRQALEEKQKTAVSPGKGTGFNYARALGITVLRPALETKQKTAVSSDGGTGFIDGVWHEPGPTAWRCQCGKPYTVTCISSKPKEKNT